MGLDFALFDQRGYPTVSAELGYSQWAPSYNNTVKDLMDLRLLERLPLQWAEAEPILDLACGTGRVGAWLHRQGARVIDGLDLTEAVLEQARTDLWSPRERGFAVYPFRRCWLSACDLRPG